IEVAYRFTAGTRGGDKARAALRRAETLTARLGNPPNLVGQQALMAGIGGICEGRWGAASELCGKAETILRERGSGVGWELSSARVTHLLALWYLGDLPAIRTRLPALLREAQDRGDLYAATSYGTYFTPMLHLMDDQVDAAAESLTASLHNWSQQGFHFQHYYSWFAGVQLDLYAGRPEAA